MCRSLRVAKCRLLLFVLAWKDISNLQLLHPVLSSKPDESFSKIPAAAFTLNPEMTKRNNELRYKGKISALTGDHLTETSLPLNIEELPDMYLILVTKYDDDGNSVRDKLADYIKYRAGNDARDNLLDYIKYRAGNDARDNLLDYIKYKAGNDVKYNGGYDVKYEDGHDLAAAIAKAIVSGGGWTADDGQSSENLTPSGPIVHHKPRHYGSRVLTDDHYHSGNHINTPIFKKQSSHSIYLDKDFNPDDLDDKNIRISPKTFPSKLMMNDKVAKKPDPLVVYVNKDLPSDTSNDLRAMYKPQESSLPMSVYVDNNYSYKPDDNDDNGDDAKTLQELINEMHDSRHPTPIKVLINKEEPQKDQETESELAHIQHLMYQIRALNKLLHGNNSPEPYTMYVNDQVISSEEETTPFQHQHLSAVDSEHLSNVGSEQAVVHEICEQLGAAFCAEHLQSGRRDDGDDDDGEAGRVVARRKGSYQKPLPKIRKYSDVAFLPTTPHDGGHQWAVFNHDKDQKLKQYVIKVNGQQTFIV